MVPPLDRPTKVNQELARLSRTFGVPGAARISQTYVRQRTRRICCCATIDGNKCTVLTRRAEENAMGDLLQPTHLIILAVVAFILFGAKRLPELGKGLGEGLKGFKEGIKGITEPTSSAPVQQASVSQPNSTVEQPK